MTTPKAATINTITSRIIEATIEIHRQLCPGLLERAYLTCLIRDLTETRLPLETQRAIPLVYKGVRADCAYRADLIVDRCVLVEVKAIDAIAPIHIQQVYTYLRLGTIRSVAARFRREDDESRTQADPEWTSGRVARLRMAAAMALHT